MVISDIIIPGKDEFDMCTIDLSKVSFSFEEKREIDIPSASGVWHKKIVIGSVSFYTNEETRVNNITYMLHHIDEEENIAYLLPVTRHLN